VKGPGKLVFAPEAKVLALSRGLPQSVVLGRSSFEVVGDVEDGRVRVSRVLFDQVFEVVGHGQDVTDAPADFPVSTAAYHDFIGECLVNAPDRYDGDEAAESIIVRYIRDLESRLDPSDELAPRR
jgi:hypothetical protein